MEQIDGDRPAPDDEAASFARGVVGPFGKFDREVKTYLDDHTFGLLLRWAGECHVDKSELLRELLYMALHGQGVHDMVAKVNRAHMEAQGLNAALLRNGVFRGEARP